MIVITTIVQNAASSILLPIPLNADLTFDNWRFFLVQPHDLSTFRNHFGVRSMSMRIEFLRVSVTGLGAHREPRCIDIGSESQSFLSNEFADMITTKQEQQRMWGSHRGLSINESTYRELRDGEQASHVTYN